MKRIDDKKIIEQVKKEESNYQIKLTSQEILNSYYALNEIKPQKEKENKKRNRKTIGFSILGSALLVGALSAIIVIIPKNNNHNNPNEVNFITPNSSKTLTTELLTFASFNNDNISKDTRFLNKIFKFRKDFNLNSRENSNLSEETLRNIVQGYDKISLGINNLFNLENNLTHKDYAETFKYKDKEYLYRTDYLLNNQIISTLYYNDLSRFDDGDELNNYLNALYLVNNKYYEVYINQEIEKEDNDEIENEIEAIFIGEDEFYKVNKEEEVEGNESENNFTYTQYDSINDAFLDDDNYIYQVEYNYEVEGNKGEIELSIDDKLNNLEYQYQHITKLSENHYRFYYEYEDDSSDQEFEGYVELVINSDNSRTYSANGTTIKII